MPTSDGFTELHPNVISAARAAATWARTRRATWTDAPLPDIPFLPEPRTREDEFGPDSLRSWRPEPEPDAARIAPPIAPPPPPVRVPEGPSAAARAADFARSAGAPIARWLTRAAVAAAAVGAVVVGGKYAWSAIQTMQIRKPAAGKTERKATVKPPAGSGLGGLEINSMPTGAEVLVDGKARGVTPVTLTDIAPGRHTIILKSTAGTVGRTVTVTAGETALVDESIFSGFVAVFSPFELTIMEGGRALTPDDRGQVMMAPGRHELRLVNRSLGYDVPRQVDVKPGETTRLTIAAPRSTISVTSADPAEVWIDGSRVGDIPVSAFPIDIGTHDVVLKSSGGSERRFTVTVTTSPFRLNADAAQ